MKFLVGDIKNEKKNSKKKGKSTSSHAKLKMSLRLMNYYNLQSEASVTNECGSLMTILERERSENPFIALTNYRRVSFKRASKELGSVAFYALSRFSSIPRVHQEYCACVVSSDRRNCVAKIDNYFMLRQFNLLA